MKQRINDSFISHRWTHSCEDGEEKEIYIPPYFYSENGTPVCGCGEDMEYEGTYIDVDKIKETKLKTLLKSIK
jgi:hypothetical protein